MTPAIFALLLALLEGDRHGYALMADVEEMTDGLIKLGPGTLYRSLQRMRVDGLIQELDDEASEPGPDRRSERRRSYRITPEGRKAVTAEAQRLAVFVKAAKERGVL
jgi:DNA-binding PadR family transcriptional regulator